MWFGYDPLGRCVKRWVGPYTPENYPAYNANPATYMAYDGWNLIQDGPQPWNAEHVYIHGGRVDEIVTSYRWGQPRYHHYDAMGNCTLLTDGGGNILEQYDYDGFGQPYFYDAQGNTFGNSLAGNRFLFTGREWLSEVHLYDYRNRLYQPELGRFMQPDPKEFGAGDYNLYRYCHNDPVNHVAKGMLQGTAAAATILGAPLAYEAAGNALLSIASRVPFVARLIGVATAAATKELTSPKVRDPKLGNLVRDLYKGTQAANPIGNGSTADAVRHELATGQAVGGTFHSQKAEQYMRALGNWLQRNPDASQRDKMVAETLRRDLKDALNRP
jgi:RHS repeat-associated protein